MRLVDDTELNDIISLVLLRSNILIPYSSQVVFYLLAIFGFRINEVEKLHLWTDLGNSNYAVQTSKKGGIRIVTINLHNEIINQAIKKRKPIENLQSRELLEKSFVKCNNYNNLRVGNKDTILHSFRHNYIKQLAANGMSKSDIKTLMALQSVDTVNTYISSQIYIY